VRARLLIPINARIPYSYLNLRDIELVWTAPELLRLEHDRPVLGTQKGDVYSFAIILQEMLTRDRPYGGLQEEQTPEGSLLLCFFYERKPKLLCRDFATREEG